MEIEDLTKEMIEYLDRNQLDAACVLAGGFPSHGHNRNVPAREIERICKKNPKRLIPFCRFFYENPIQPDGWGDEKDRALGEFDSMLKSGSFKGLAEVNMIESGAEDPLKACRAYYPFMEILSKYKLPVEIHTGFSGKRPMSFYDPILVDELASRFPEVPFILNHCGTMLPPYGDLSLYIAAKNDNLFLQISQLTLVGDHSGHEIYKNYVARALAAFRVGASKLIFGTDWNPENGALCDLTVNLLKEVKMSENERDLVMGGTLQKILGL